MASNAWVLRSRCPACLHAGFSPLSVGHSSMIVATIFVPPLVISMQAPQSVTVLKPFDPGIAAK